MLVLQITETDGIHDSIVINKPQIFSSYADPDFMDYITSKIHRELNPPDMSEWTLEELDATIDTPKKKRGRPKGSRNSRSEKPAGLKKSLRKKVKVPYVEEDFMDTTTD
jgi:hypothetical protein